MIKHLIRLDCQFIEHSGFIHLHRARYVGHLHLLFQFLLVTAVGRCTTTIQYIFQVLSSQITFHFVTGCLSFIYELYTGISTDNQIQHLFNGPLWITEHNSHSRLHCIRILFQSVYIEETFIHKQYIYHIRPIKSNTGYFAGSSHIHGTLFVGSCDSQLEFRLLAACG